MKVPSETADRATKGLLPHITPLILMWNEELNIGRVLDRLKWAKRIVLVDSFSSDNSLTIARQYPNVSLYNNRFTDHASQWNFGLRETGIDTKWVLALDADYVLTDDLVEELSKLGPPEGVSGYYARFRYAIHGTILSKAIYPPVIVLFRHSGARYIQQGHTQRVLLEGHIETLKSVIVHDDRKPMLRWLASQDRYATLECEHLSKARWSELRWQDRVRKGIIIAPWLVPLYFLLIKGGLIDGYAGWLYALQRGIAEAVLSMKLAERRMFARGNIEE